MPKLYHGAGMGLRNGRFSYGWFATELGLFGGLALAWLLGFGLFFLDRAQAGLLLPPGVLTALLECLLEISIIVSLCRAPDPARESRLFLWFFCLLLPADLCYLVLRYVLRRNGADWATFLLTIIPYSLAYVLGAVALFQHLKPRLSLARWRSFVWLPGLLLVPTLFGVMLPLLYAQQRTDGWDFALTQISFNSAFALLFFFWSALTLAMSLDRVFAFVGLAGVITQLGNWEGNSVYLLQPQAFAFGEYEFLWLCGIMTFWYAFVVVPRLPAAAGASLCGADAAQRRSLAVQQRMTVLGLISASLICAVLLFRRDVWSYRIVFFGMALGAYISLIVGELLSRQIIHYATLFGRIVNLTGKDGSARAQEREIPAELWEVYRMAFHQDMMEQRTRAAVRENLAELAAQVAHDIRSPLAALDSAAKDAAGLPEEKRIMIRSAAGRIHDIANDLIEKNRGLRGASRGGGGAASEPAARELLSSHVSLLITEKRLQFRSRIGIAIEGRVDAASYGLFAEIQPSEFKRVLSNLINNAVEALGEKGLVEVRLSSSAGQVLLEVRDDGKGIPPEVLARLGGRGETHGKAGGSGLGLYHARASAAAWGGSLELRSEAGRGTVVTLRLPQARPPDWFVSRLELEPGMPVVVLDDDASIHQVWQGRFDSLRAREHGLSVLHFSTTAEVRGWAGEDPDAARRALYLTDYELAGSRETGLDLVAGLGIGERSVLVTSRFEEAGILADCQRLKVRLIPKGLAGFVPVSIAAAGTRRRGPDAALLDDDALVRKNWAAAAGSRGLELAAFAEAAELLAAAAGWPRDTPIYLDAKLGGGRRGEDVARDLHAQGFTELYLATGYDPDSLPAMPCIRKVVGKAPPWG